MRQGSPARPDCPVSTATLRQQIHDCVDQVSDWCENCDTRFFSFESKLRERVWEVALLFIRLFLLARHQRLEKQDRGYPGYERFSECLSRTLRTMFGEVRYERAYWHKRQGGGGFHPLDVELGLTRDGFSPWVISLACRLATYLSYAKTTLIMEAFWGWSPSTETVEQWVLGVAREAEAYMASAPPFPEADGEVLVIEVDGKAVPTATEAELAKRRGPRRQQARLCCGCQRHRGRAKRRGPNAKSKGGTSGGARGTRARMAAVRRWWPCTRCGGERTGSYMVRSTSACGAVSLRGRRCWPGRGPKQRGEGLARRRSVWFRSWWMGRSAWGSVCGGCFRRRS